MHLDYEVDERVKVLDPISDSYSIYTVSGIHIGRGGAMYSLEREGDGQAIIRNPSYIKKIGLAIGLEVLIKGTVSELSDSSAVIDCDSGWSYTVHREDVQDV